MHIKQRLLLLFSHTLMLAAGFAAGIYLLPLLIAAAPPSDLELSVIEDDAVYVAEFSREHPSSDFLHWGAGKLFLSNHAAGFKGALSPAPDLTLYISSADIRTPEDFARERSGMKALGRIRSFNDFLVPFGQEHELTAMRSVIVWCDSFDQFITSAALRRL